MSVPSNTTSYLPNVVDLESFDLDGSWGNQRLIPRPTAQAPLIHAAGSRFAPSTMVFDGTDDNSLAILRARDELHRIGYGTLVLPRRYQLTQPCALEAPDPEWTNEGNGFEIHGEGDNIGACIWKPNPAYYGSSAFKLMRRASDGQVWSGGGMSNIFVVAHDDVGALCTGVGIELSGTVGASLYNCKAFQFAGTGGQGILVGNDAQDNTLVHCNSIGNDIGLLIDFANNTTLVNFKGNSCYSSAFKMTRGFVCNWFGGLIQGNSTYGVHIAPSSANNVQDVTFNGVYTEVGSASVIRHDTNASTRFKWFGGRMVSNDNAAKFFHFDTQPTDIEISLPSISPVGTQKIISSTSGALIGSVSGGVSEMSSAYHEVHADSRIMWISMGDRIGFGTAPATNEYAIDCSAWRGVFGLPRYTAAQIAGINTANVSFGAAVYDTTNKVVKVWTDFGGSNSWKAVW